MALGTATQGPWNSNLTENGRAVRALPILPLEMASIFSLGRRQVDKLCVDYSSQTRNSVAVQVPGCPWKAPCQAKFKQSKRTEDLGLGFDSGPVIQVAK